MEELIRLLCEYSANGKIIDKKYLLNFFNDLANGIRLCGCTLTFAGFLKSLTSDATGFYLPFFDVVVLCYSQLKQSRLSSFDKNWQKFEIYLFRNLIVLDSLIHEMLHAKEYRICAEGEDDLETKLLLTSCSYKIIEDYIAWETTMCNEQNEYKQRSKKENAAKYKEFISRVSIIKKPYINAPHERIAEIGAKLALVEIVTQIDKDMPHLTALLIKSLLGAYLRGYNLEKDSLELADNLGPSFEYLSKTGNIELWQSFDFYDPDRKILIHKVTDAYTLEDRLYLGLPVMKSEEADIFRLAYSKFKGVSI